ncbi:DNA repair protein RecN [Limosilactobacillus secaliphilus]|uniref:DNA repair protein RecN n=1 Tax=Limosilactobacillus secaliphilus TaxID=396268 RepID=A0A0R2I249_9LACO|nr:DNA repair protein RecN [Limosilactobacillus secaliphilus]KRN59112.1 DNA repair protein RecN [Limosilactobacillus secaliphilus]
MLQELTIDDLAIIPHLSLDFDDHMTVLTGETGAGKSIIIDAVSLLAGRRGSQELIRKGSDKLEVQGQFTLPNRPAYLQELDDLGINHDDGVLIISRTIHRSGRNTIRVNGTLINTTVLKKIGSALVDIQGQNDSQRLLQPDQHLEMLDQFAGADLLNLREKYQSLYQRYSQVKATLEKKQANEQQWAQRLDMLRYQVKEIADAQLKPDEEEQLTTQRDRLEHFQQINQTLQDVITVLNGDEGAPVLDQLASLMDATSQISQFDDQYDDLAKSITDSYYNLQDAANQAGHELDNLAYDDGLLQQINDRLTLIGDLEHKYGDSLTDVLNYYDQIKKELAKMEGAADSNDDLEQQLQDLTKQLSELAGQLHTMRVKAASQLERKVHTQLSDLYMDKAVFEVKFKAKDQLTFTPTGQDNVEFYIQTNPGERLGPLVRIVSGGELSRVMLALKTIFARVEGVTSIIFDEVDTGVSGRVAQGIADKIKLIAANSQVLCITHLPQVAAVAQHHFLISKHLQKQRTVTEVKHLNNQERVDELARMLAGEKITKLTREHAQELLDMAH